jgi:hypothetical protein
MCSNRYKIADHFFSLSPISKYQFIELVSRQRRGLGASVIRGCLNLLELPYFSVTSLRNFLYDFGVFPTHRISLPIISVGNLTLGGTGKSPMVAWLGRFFLDLGFQPGLISRGYGKSVNHVNDEFLELAFRLPSVPHRLNRNRVAAAQDFLVPNGLNPVDLLILDDAFQHRRIARNLDIVLLDASEPFGYEHVFPRGTLRESIAALRRADVVLLFFEANSQIQATERQLVSFIRDEVKPCIFVVNKWDTMVGQMPTETWGEYLHDVFPDFTYVPIAFITGKTGKNIKTMLNHAQMLFNQSRQRISTPHLNKLIAAALDNNPPPLHHHHKIKIYYASQVGIAPPTIALFCNMPDAVSMPYQRYLLNFLRDELPFGEVPIRLLFRKRASNDSKDEVETKRKS